MWQHVKLSEQIRLWDTLACCWDVKQASNQPTNWLETSTSGWWQQYERPGSSTWHCTHYTAFTAWWQYVHLEGGRHGGLITAFPSKLYSVLLCRLVGLLVKESASRAEDPGFESRFSTGIFWVESYQWLKSWHSSGYPARRLAFWVSRPGVSILWLGKVESLTCSFCLSMAAHKIIFTDRSLRNFKH